MSDETTPPPTNTGEKQANGKPMPPKSTQFKKGDPRINRKGRPKGFDVVRDVALKIAKSKNDVKGAPITIGGKQATAIERGLWDMLLRTPDKFVRVAYGDPPPPIPVTALSNLIPIMPVEYQKRIVNGEALDVVVCDWAAAMQAQQEKPGRAQKPKPLQD